VPAHVTLFHSLPPSAEAEVRTVLAALSAAHAPPPALLDGVVPLGSGTALTISSPAMLALRDETAERMHGLLTPQDAGRPRLHITVQNKVSPREAKALQAALMATLEPRSFAFAGLALHYYRGGPWETIQRWTFRGRKR
jgi:hypothetical protein